MTVLAGILACFAALVVLGAVEILARALRALTAAVHAQAYATMRAVQSLDDTILTGHRILERLDKMVEDTKRRQAGRPTVYQ